MKYLELLVSVVLSSEKNKEEIKGMIDANEIIEWKETHYR